MQDKNIQLEQNFHEAMLGICEAPKRLKPPYHAIRFRQMVLELGGKGAADTLLATPNPSEGFTELFLRGRRLDLSLEYLVLKTPWRKLFLPEQLGVARKRLREHEFDPPAEDLSNASSG